MTRRPAVQHVLSPLGEGASASPTLRELPGRIVELHCGGSIVRFLAVQAYRVTQRDAMDGALFAAAEGAVVDRGATSWLAETEPHLDVRLWGPRDLRHLMVCPAGGPCYEFLCRDFKVIES